MEVNWHFSYIQHRVRLGAAKDMEVDVYAAAGAEVWLCESKWWRGRKAGVAEVESLLAKGRLVRSNIGEGLEVLRLWIFAHDGFTEEAQKLRKYIRDGQSLYGECNPNNFSRLREGALLVRPLFGSVLLCAPAFFRPPLLTVNILLLLGLALVLPDHKSEQGGLRPQPRVKI